MKKLRHFRGSATPTAIPLGPVVLLDVELEVQSNHSSGQDSLELSFC